MFRGKEGDGVDMDIDDSTYVVYSTQQIALQADCGFCGDRPIPMSVDPYPVLF